MTALQFHTAATFEDARADFERAWRVFLSNRTDMHGPDAMLMHVPHITAASAIPRIGNRLPTLSRCLRLTVAAVTEPISQSLNSAGGRKYGASENPGPYFLSYMVR